MNRLLSLWLAGALLLPSCWGNGGRSQEEEEEEEEEEEVYGEEYGEYDDVTPTPEYEYEDHTFDYEVIINTTADYNLLEVLELGLNRHNPTDKAAGIGRLTPVLLLGLAAQQMWT